MYFLKHPSQQRYRIIQNRERFTYLQYLRRRRSAIRNQNGAAAGGMGCTNPGERVFKYDAIRRRNADALCCQKKNIGCRLSVRNITPCDHGIEKFRQTGSRKIMIDEMSHGT